VPQDPAELRKKTIEVAKIYLASGIDPKKSTLFIQSQISKHAQLAWILNTITKNGDLTKMTQFKSKSGLSIDFDDVEKMLERIRQWNIPDPTNSERRLSTPQYVSAFAKELTSSIKQSFNNSSVGLFDYPVLMAADILLYDTDVVPVGKDQLQHIELARTLARRFNERFGETLVIPEGKISKEGALIMGLDDPSKKMSKSAPSEYNYIALSDTPDQVRRKIMKAVTDSGSEIAYGDEKPALKNLINIYSLLSDETPEAIISKFSGKGYGDFKKDLAEVVVAFLAPLQERVAALSDEEVLKTLAEGREKNPQGSGEENAGGFRKGGADAVLMHRERPGEAQSFFLQEYGVSVLDSERRSSSE
jgi:tryptophanyl-tRNA synthetase